MAAGIVKRKSGVEWEFPMWLVWSLIVLVVLLLIIGLMTGTLRDLIGKVIEVIKQS